MVTVANLYKFHVKINTLNKKRYVQRDMLCKSFWMLGDEAGGKRYDVRNNKNKA